MQPLRMPQPLQLLSDLPECDSISCSSTRGRSMEACDLPGVVQSPARAPNYGRAVNVGAFSPAAPFPALLLSSSEEGLYNARPQHKHAAISARATTTLGQADRRTATASFHRGFYSVRTNSNTYNHFNHVMVNHFWSP